MESAPDKDAVKVTTKHLDYYINIVDKAVTEFEKIDSNFEINFTGGKILCNSITGYIEITHERKSLSMWQTSLLY